MNEHTSHKLTEISMTAEGITIILDDPNRTDEDVRNARNMAKAITHMVERIYEYIKKDEV